MKFQKSGGEIVEQIIRPTGLLDPEVFIRPTHKTSRKSFSRDKKKREKKGKGFSGDFD